MASTADFRNGLCIEFNNGLYTIVHFQHVKPGKGAAFVRTKLRNLKSGSVLEKTFKGEEKIEEAFVEERKLRFLYRSDKLYYFMDEETFEEVSISEDILGQNSKFLK